MTIMITFFDKIIAMGLIDHRCTESLILIVTELSKIPD